MILPLGVLDLWSNWCLAYRALTLCAKGVRACETSGHTARFRAQIGGIF